MAKIKLNFDAEKYKEDYNKYMLSNYNKAKEKYRKARQTLIASFLFAIANLLCFFWCVKIHCIDFGIIINVFCLIILYLLYKAYSIQMKGCFCDIKLRQKNYEDVMSIEQYTERYWMQIQSPDDRYKKTIYDLANCILNNNDYKLLDISVTDRQSENDYLLTIYYSVNSRVEVEEVLLHTKITTETDDFEISFLDMRAWLLIPYTKRNELSPDVEYYADITKYL